jgi:RNA polymerase sigma-70 factor (ECF subfamily)
MPRSWPVTMTSPHRLPYRGPEWVERIRAGDEAAFEALFRALAPGLCALVTRYVGARAVAEEIVQDLFLDVWTRRTELAIDRSIGAYLFTAARNRALNHARRERRVVDLTLLERGDQPDPASPGEAELLDALELQDAIAQLPARCRLIFTLNRHQDLSYTEIAASLGLSVKTVETQMGRALKALRDRLRHIVR